MTITETYTEEDILEIIKEYSERLGGKIKAQE